MTVTLAQLVDTARARLVADRRRTPPGEIAARLRDSDVRGRPAGRFAAALRGPEIALIAEVKRASPVDGTIREDFDAASVARDYANAGAAAVSVLTEETYFGGSLAVLGAVSECIDLPTLRKDFIVDAYQIQQAALAGASAVLLIAEVLEATHLADLVAQAHGLHLDALVEVHRPDSVAAAVASGSGLLGVNNRDLETMRVDWTTALNLFDGLPTDHLLVAESGIARREQVVALEAVGYDAILVGSSLMRADDPAAALRALRGVR